MMILCNDGSYWKRYFQERLQKKEIQCQDLLKLANIAAKILIEEYGATKVVIFGSILDPASFKENSDLDLAVIGLKDRLYFNALAESYKLLPEGCHLDLVLWEDALEKMKKIKDVY